MVGAPAASTPTTRTSGRTAARAAAIPEMSPPPRWARPPSRLGRLLGQLQPDGALAGDDQRVVEGGHEHRLAVLAEVLGAGDAVVDGVAAHPHGRPVVPGRLDLGQGALTGMKMVAGWPVSLAARATPGRGCRPTRPPPACPGGSREIRL